MSRDKGNKVCPRCGYDLVENGYYVKTSFSGKGIYFYNFDGTASKENSQMYDTVKINESKSAYCIYCNNRLSNL